MKFRGLLPFLLFSLTLPATGQIFRSGNVKVRVTYDDNDRAVSVQVHVQLMANGANSAISDGYTDRDGMVEFYNVPIGNYHMVASGEGIETTDSGMFEVDTRKGSQYLYIRVRSSRQSEATPKQAGGSTVSAADLNIPESAKKEFDKASDLMAAEKWPKALEHLQKAIAIHPKYVAAYNNIGVVYARLGNRELERDALNKAIESDGHFAPAFTNLARMSIADHDYPQAEMLLNKATAGDPNDVTVLILLANVQLLNHHYDEAIASAGKAHSLSDDHHALVHYIAARAYGHKNLVAEERAELELFLKEEPDGPRAEAARREMAALKTQQ